MIETEDDLTFTNEKLFFTNQTTLSSYQTAALYESIARKYPHALISNEICSATRCRQQAVMKLERADAFIVVGDPKSHNTRKLAQLAQNKADHVFCVENLEALLKEDLHAFQKVAVTSGASTPTKITQQIIHYLQTEEIIPLKTEDVI